MRRAAVLLLGLAATVFWAPSASAGTSPVDELLARCPTAEEVAAVGVPITFDTDPTAGTLVCTATSGSTDLTRLQQRAYQAILVMQALNFRQPLPWTSGGSLSDWFQSAVAGVRFRSDIANNFCCEPARVINILTPSASDLETSRWVDPSGGWGMKGLVDVMAHEARHAEGPGHTCAGANDATFTESGAWAIVYYLGLWETLYSGPFLTAPGPYDAYYRDNGLYSDFIAENRICTAPAADLSLSIAAPNPVPRGGSLPYAITVRNAGPAAAPEVYLYSAIPVGTILSSTLAGSGSCIGPAGGRNGSVGCSLGPLPAGASTSVQLNFRVIAGQDQSSVSNRESSIAVGTHVSGTVHDAYAANNTAAVTTGLVNVQARVETVGATGVDRTTATVNGIVDANGTDATYHFAYGTTTGYGSETPVRNLRPDANGQAVAEPLTGLRPRTTYHYRLESTNGSGTSVAGDKTFRTRAVCVVPRVTGKTLAVAKRALRRAHCSPGRVRRAHARARRGRVISQRPRAGARLGEGARIGLVVSLGPRRR